MDCGQDGVGRHLEFEEERTGDMADTKVEFCPVAWDAGWH